MKYQRVGILGGMGPEATVLLMQRVIAAVSASDDADHIPLIVDQNPQVPSRIAHLIEGTGDSPAPVLAGMAARLEAAGALALAMPCNTAHHYVQSIIDAVQIPFLNMVDLSVHRAMSLTEENTKIGVLGSPALRQAGIFQKTLEKVSAEAVYPDDEAALLNAIRSIKSRGPSEEATAVLQAASGELLARDIRVQLVACTEFSLIAEPVVDGAVAVDTLDCLVDGIVNFARSGT